MNNSKKKRWFIAMALPLVCTVMTQAQSTLMMDNDGTELLTNAYWNGAPLEPWQIDSVVRMGQGTQVGAYVICAGSDFVYYPSRYSRRFGDDQGGRIGHGGNQGLWNVLNTCHQNALRLDSAGVDFIGTQLKAARHYGMQAVVAFRMNDLHFADTEIDCPVAYSDWWVAHPEHRIGDNTIGWHSAGAYNFAHKEVRQRKVAIIKEILQRYGAQMDMLLIDYMRFFCYFKRGEGQHHTQEMTAMLRDIRHEAMRQSHRLHRKTPIKIGVRVAPSIAENLEQGIDLRQWLSEGLIDMVSVGIHTVVDPAMPIAQLRSDLGEALHVPLYASTDMVTYAETEPLSEGMVRAFCASMLDQGADGIYLFNYFMSAYNSGRYKTEPGGEVCRINHPRMFGELGNLTTLSRRNKTYWLSDGKRQYGLHPNTPLPLTLQPSEQGEAIIHVADNIEQAPPQEVILFLRTRGEAQFSISLNGTLSLASKPDYPARYDKLRRLDTHDRVYALTFPASALRQGRNQVIIRASNSAKVFTIKRIELSLKYGEAAQFGYF